MMKTNSILLAAALAVSVHSAKAAAGDWTGATSGNWNVDSNWTGAAYPQTIPDVATFNADVANSTVSLNGAAIELTSIQFATGAEAYTFNAGGGSLLTRAITINSGVGAVTQTFNLTVNISTATSTFSNSSTTANLDLAGGIDNVDPNTLVSRQLTFAGVGTTSVNGLTQSGGQTTNLLKNDSGKVISSGIDTRTGTTVLRDGIFQINGGLSSGNAQMSGGVVGLGAGDFTRGLGTGNNQFRWVAPTTNSAAGFAAYGANRNVNLGGAAAVVTWGATTAIRTDQQLALGSVDSTHTLTFQNALNLSDATRTIVVNDGTSSTNVDGEISGVISSTTASLGAVTKTGTGTLLVSGVNTYTGMTTVSAGTLLVGNDSGVGSLAGAVTVGSDAILGGSGTIAGAVTIQDQGTLAPGNSAGILTVSNNVTIESGGIFSVELDGEVAGTEYDRLVMTGAGSVFSLTGTNDLSLSLGFVPAQDTLFFLVDNGGSSAISGTFESLNGVATTLTQGSIFNVGGQEFSISYTGNLAGNTFLGGNDLVIQAVPEPSTWLLGVLGVVFLIVRRWSARSKEGAELA